MIYPVRLYGDPILRKKARPVSVFDDDLATLAEDMIETMYHYNGVGLAGPQIGIAKRIFVALELTPDHEEEEDAPKPQTREEKAKAWGVRQEHVIINPEFLAREGQDLGQEGCLSLPALYVEDVPRFEKIRFRFQDVQGNWHEASAEKHFARVLQHENDHLDGIMYFDRLDDSSKRDFMREHRQALADLQREAKAFLKDLRVQTRA